MEKSFYTFSICLRLLTSILTSSWIFSLADCCCFFPFRKEISKITWSSIGLKFFFVAKSWITLEYKQNTQTSDFIKREKEIPPSWLFSTVCLCQCWRSIFQIVFILGTSFRGKNLEFTVLEAMAKSHRQCQFIIITLPFFLFLILYFALLPSCQS